MVEVIAEHNAPPLVRVFASRLRLSLTPPNDAALEGLRGSVFSLRSSKNASAVTIRIKDDHISLAHGVARDSAVVITLDFDNPRSGQKVKGLLRHPWLALRIGKLLDLPQPDWTDSAARFFELTRQLPDQPGTIKITCTDTPHSVTLGNNEPMVEVLGPSATLQEVFAGHSLMVMEVITGTLKFRGSMQYLAGLSMGCQKLMLGELEQDT